MYLLNMLIWFMFYLMSHWHLAPDRQTDRGAGLGQANCHHLSNMGKNEYNDCTKERQPCHMLLCADWLQV